jgi:hypothetical protein
MSEVGIGSIGGLFFGSQEEEEEEESLVVSDNSWPYLH